MLPGAFPGVESGGQLPTYFVPATPDELPPCPQPSIRSVVTSPSTRRFMGVPRIPRYAVEPRRRLLGLCGRNYMKSLLGCDLAIPHLVDAQPIAFVQRLTYSLHTHVHRDDHRDRIASHQGRGRGARMPSFDHRPPYLAVLLA